MGWTLRQREKFCDFGEIPIVILITRTILRSTDVESSTFGKSPPPILVSLLISDKWRFAVMFQVGILYVYLGVISCSCSHVDDRVNWTASVLCFCPLSCIFDRFCLHGNLSLMACERWESPWRALTKWFPLPITLVGAQLGIQKSIPKKDHA